MAFIWIRSSTGCERADVTGVNTSAAWMRLVEFPQQRNFMHRAVADPVAEIEQQHLSDGDGPGSSG
jgi:hypothetical protein